MTNIIEIYDTKMTQEEHERALKRVDIEFLFFLLRGYKNVLTNGTQLSPESRLKREHWVELLEDMIETAKLPPFDLNEVIEVLGEPKKITKIKNKFKKDLYRL